MEKPARSQPKMQADHSSSPQQEQPPRKYRVTPIEQGMLFDCLAKPGTGIDVAQTVVKVEERVDKAAFTGAWQRLLDRHEALRMLFCLEPDGSARQFPAEGATIDIHEEDWSELPESEHNKLLQAFLENDRNRGFDPRSDLPTRVAIFHLSDSKYQFVFTWWHGILDGRSNFIVIREFFAYYDAFRRGTELDIPLPKRYVDYAGWVSDASYGDASRAYWKKVLAGYREPTRLPGGSSGETGFGAHELKLSRETTASIASTIARHGLTLNTVVQAAWALVLSQYSGQDDVVFGATRACRHSAFGGDGSGDGIVGALINTVAVRVKLPPEVRVLDWLAELREQHVAVRPHELTPLADVQECSEVPRGQRLFDSIVVFERQTLDSALKAKGGHWNHCHFEMYGRTVYPLTVYAYGEAELLLGINNDRSRVDDLTAERMLDHFGVAVAELAEHLEDRLVDVPLLPEQERRVLLDDFNRTSIAYPANSTIQELFSQQVLETPNAPALTFHGSTWTYRELSDRADAVATLLRKSGVGSGALIAVCMNRCFDLVAGILAILKTGAAYLPLDPTYPPDRLAELIHDARPELVLSNEESCQSIPTNTRVLVLHKHASSEVSIVPEQKPEFSRYDNLAYVIYTSGSTGKPKGVMVEHATVMNFFTAMDQVIGPEKGVWLAVVNVSFDPSVLELWWSLTRGLHVVFWGGIHDVLERPIPELIQKFSVTHMTLIPSFLRTVLMLPGASESLARLRVLALGGEACPVNLVRELGHAPNRRILNFYGPTETTVVATAWEIPPNPDFMSIGRPIANAQTFVLDQQLRLKPLGAVGELYVGGSSVARGYLRRPELTDERFIKNSFSTTSDRLYRTGDLARYREDGTLEYAGRIDGQVKIRGHRVELGEIEACLGRSPEVKAAAVDVRPGSSGETRLIAYVVPRPGEPPSKRALRESLQCVLPSYMIPADFVFVGSLPCTENGKLDRHALPAPPETGTSDAELTREPTPLEAKLLLVWCEALNRKTVGLDDNFFEIGGDSLAAIALIVGIEKYFNVELPLQALFNHPTVARLSDELARLLEGNGLVQSRPDDGQPRTATERQILAIWRNLLPACRIGMRDSFFGLGGAPFFDQMLAALRDSFGAYAEAIPRGLIIEDATIEAIARMIDEQVEPVSPLVLCVQPNGHGRPLFLIHDGAGQLFFYPVLAAHLGNDRPVYGLRPPTKSHGHYRSFEKTRTVQELAELYITEIRKIRPHGPYLLGGSCFGGVIAFEMAQQLRAAGDDVGPLLLFDSFVLNNARARHMDAFTPKTFLRRFMSHIEVARRIGGLKGLVHVMLDLWTHRSIYLTKIFNALKRHTRSVAEALYKQVRNLVTKPDHMTVPANVKERILRDGWIKITERLMKRYVPHVYEGSIVFFKASESDDPEPLWTGLATCGITVHRLPGRHLDMLKEPAVGVTAAFVHEHLDAFEKIIARAEPAGEAVFFERSTT